MGVASESLTGPWRVCLGCTEHIEGVTTSLGRLKELLELIQSEQAYYKSRERRHRQSTFGFIHYRLINVL